MARAGVGAGADVDALGGPQPVWLQGWGGPWLSHSLRARPRGQTVARDSAGVPGEAAVGTRWEKDVRASGGVEGRDVRVRYPCGSAWH